MSSSTVETTATPSGLESCVQRQLAALVAGVESGAVASPLDDVDRLVLVRGITCYGIYHAGRRN